MIISTAIMLAVLCLLLCFSDISAKYQPTWPSLDARPLPQWYDEVKFGIFCHWGVYSVPAYRSEWLWWYWKGPTPDKDVVNYINRNYKPGTTYADFAKDFTAELFNAREFADIVKSSGAKCMRELKDAFKGTDVHFGLYFSQFEWFHPMFLDDLKYNTSTYVDQVSYPQMLEIVNRYKPEIVWSDGDWGKSDEYWRSKEFLAWLYNTSPVKEKVVVNDRWGGDCIGKHGGFLTFADHFDPGKLLSRKWENCMTLDKAAWGSRRTMKSTEVYTVHELIEQLARTVSCGGNYLLNVGPDMHGKIAPIFEDRLRELGRFISSHSEALYGTKPWIHQNDTGNTWYTSRVVASDLPPDRLFNPQIEGETTVYAWILDMPTKDFELKNIKTTDSTKVTFLGTNTSFKPGAKSSLLINFERIPWRHLVRNDVMVLKIENAASQMRVPHKGDHLAKSRTRPMNFVNFQWAYDAF